MKNIIKYVIFAASAVLATSSNAGTKGSEAAGLITSTPDTKNPVEGLFEISMIGYDIETETTFETFIPVSKDMPWESVYIALANTDYSLESAAENALMALSKVAYAEGLAEYNKLRIERLTESVNKAFKSLDTIDLRDDVNEITKRLEKKDTTDDTTTIYGGNSIFNVAAAQADGKTIESNSNDRLQIYGFPGADRTNVGLFPVIGNNSGEVGRMMWFDPWNYLDGDTINVDRSDEYSHLPSKASGKHGIHLAGWYTPTSDPNKCSSGDTIADQLKRGANTHYVLTQFKNDSQLHYTEVGKLLTGSAIKIVGTQGGGEAVIGSGSTTNTLTFASAGDSNVKVTVSGTDGNATVTIGVYYR
uniref:Uncharacterized protein n=1 Tax=uncultured bacterium fosmid pJB16B1 TaxID=1478054 RepID=A0A0H3U7F3_9BACT|nr:hypothetical protein [uncultured bacterium fosmid pJB16B1]